MVVGLLTLLFFFAPSVLRLGIDPLIYRGFAAIILLVRVLFRSHIAAIARREITLLLCHSLHLLCPYPRENNLLLYSASHFLTQITAKKETREQT
jgi:hypothetical protein